MSGSLRFGRTRRSRRQISLNYFTDLYPERDQKALEGLKETATEWFTGTSFSNLDYSAGGQAPADRVDITSEYVRNCANIYCLSLSDVQC